MRLFYRTTIALCVLLAITFLTAGTAAALEPIGNITEPIADCSYTISDSTAIITDNSINADRIQCDWGDGNIDYIEPGETISHTYTPTTGKMFYSITYTAVLSINQKFSLKIINFWI